MMMVGTVKQPPRSGGTEDTVKMNDDGGHCETANMSLVCVICCLVMA
jgi:hypothetical protein